MARAAFSGAGDRREVAVMQFEQVDKLIEVLAEDITKKVESERCEYKDIGEIIETTKALAALIAARALLT